MNFNSATKERVRDSQPLATICPNDEFVLITKGGEGLVSFFTITQWNRMVSQVNYARYRDPLCDDDPEGAPPAACVGVESIPGPVEGCEVDGSGDIYFGPVEALEHLSRTEQFTEVLRTGPQWVIPDSTAGQPDSRPPVVWLGDPLPDTVGDFPLGCAYTGDQEPCDSCQ